MIDKQPHRIKSITEFHRFRELPKPEHPLVSVIDLKDMRGLRKDEPRTMVYDYYFIALKKDLAGKMIYGQQEYDFDEGVMFFIAPNQVFSIAEANTQRQSGWMLLIHPDFLWNTSLAKKIKKCEFFGYSVHEALYLSEKEEEIISTIMQNIKQEYHSNIDKFSQSVIIAQIELLLTYAERFYSRQFITRKITNHKVLTCLEDLLEEYFDSDNVNKMGLPSVQYIAEKLNLSPNYLSDLLKTITGQTTQQHIHDKIIEKAKEKLSTTDLSISEIAYTLGFEYSQSFSKLFKSKTNLSPLEFRRSFN